MHVKKNDTVVITTGKERGERGRVLRVLKTENKVIVERRNLIKRHTRPNAAAGVEGGIIEREAAIHASNVALYSPQLDGPVRTQLRFMGEGGKAFPTREEALATYGANPPKQVRKVRYAPKTGEIFE